MDTQQKRNKLFAPLLLVAGFLVAGVITSWNTTNDAGLQANITEQTIVSGSICPERDRQEVQSCTTESGTSGKQIWICNELRRWEKWGECRSN